MVRSYETTKPSSDAVRNYLHERRNSHTPPPDIEEIRRQLGWGMTITSSAPESKKIYDQPR